MNDAAAWSAQAAQLAEANDWRAAHDAFARACAFAPDDPRHLVGRALALLALQRIAALVDARDMLLARHSKFGAAHLIDGHVNKVLGEHALAAAAYRRALSIEPTLSEAWFNLADLDASALERPLVVELERLLAGVRNSRDEANLSFALARALEAAGLYPLAFERYQQGNRAAREVMLARGVQYDPTAWSDQVAAFIEADANANALPPLALDFSLIFIVGLPRSGTTLVEHLLARHPEVATGGELPLMPECHRHYLRQKNQREEASLLREARARYLDGLLERQLAGRWVTDKLPANFALLGFIRRVFPNAIIVHCSRDPIAVCWSLYTAHFGAHEPYYNSFDDLAHYHGQYRRLMKHWSATLSPAPIEVRYERLVCNVEESRQRLYAACELPHSDALMAHEAVNRPVFTASQSQVRRSVYTSSINRWRHYEALVQPLAQCLADQS